VESVTQAVCDLALRFGESVEDEDALMVRHTQHLAYLHLHSLEPSLWRCAADSGN
jgi:hypothetical protein